MPSDGLVRAQVVRRLLEVIRLDDGYSDDIQLDVGTPRVAWAEASRYVVVTRVTGTGSSPVFQAQTMQDMAVVEMWAQGFASGETDDPAGVALEAADLAEQAANLVIRSVQRNRRLSLGDDRLIGVQTSEFDELDGPLFLAVDHGVIASYRMTLNVTTRVRTET